MLILSIDTSGKNGSVALAHGDAEKFQLIATSPVEGGTFSAQLIPQIARLLSENNLKKRDIDAFAAATGPGSFTGLRIGLTAVKGLAEILGKPIAAVSVLEACVLTSGINYDDARVFAALDAQRNEVYLGEYMLSRGIATKKDEVLVTRDEFVARVQGRVAVTPDEELVKAARSAAAVRIERPTSTDIARIGLQKMARGETVSVEELD
ncbi:MAG: tRNA (adenosine(37)-N6)-threonylcarbamoyltransferase complex dimerization subunit type 1 TsaB, partial [Terriglobales bacterium]